MQFQCDVGLESCLDNMTTMFDAWKKDPLTTRYNSLPDIRLIGDYNAWSLLRMSRLCHCFPYLHPQYYPDLRKLVYFYGVRQGNQKDWERVLDEVFKTKIPSAIQPLLIGLTGTRDTWNLYR